MNNFIRKAGWRVRRWMRKCSFDVVRFDRQNADYQILNVINRRGIEYIVDVGANRGQFATYIRLQGFSGKIFSFEPLPDAFSTLQQAAKEDGKIDACNFALSDRTGTTTLHVGSNDQTSSFHHVLTTDTADMEVTHDIIVPIDTLDNILANGPLSGIDPSKILLKLDVQGHELQALMGGHNSLHYISAVFLEASITKIYENEASYFEIIDYLKKYGLMIKSFKGGYYHPKTGSLSQIDILFEKLA